MLQRGPLAAGNMRCITASLNSTASSTLVGLQCCSTAHWLQDKCSASPFPCAAVGFALHCHNRHNLVVPLNFETLGVLFKWQIGRCFRFTTTTKNVFCLRVFDINGLKIYVKVRLAWVFKLFWHMMYFLLHPFVLDHAKYWFSKGQCKEVLQPVEKEHLMQLWESREYRAKGTADCIKSVSLITWHSRPPQGSFGLWQYFALVFSILFVCNSGCCDVCWKCN